MLYVILADATVPAVQSVIWIIEHFSALGWPALCYGVWKGARLLTQVEERAIQAEQHINTLATNHFPHMEASLANQDNLLKSMDGSLKTMVSSLDVLASQRPKRTTIRQNRATRPEND
jgi:hypothetical protein